MCILHSNRRLHGGAAVVTIHMQSFSRAFPVEDPQVYVSERRTSSIMVYIDEETETPLFAHTA